MTEAGWTREKAEKLCEAWFDTGARASWCPKMVDEFAAALADSYQQGRVAGLREAAEMVPGIMQHPHGSSKDWCEAQRAICAAIKRRAQQAQDEKGVGGWKNQMSAITGLTAR